MAVRWLARGSRLLLASHNPGKLAEIAELVRSFGVEVISSAAFGLPEPEESAQDFVGNACLKALAAARASDLPALADDSGFSVAALNGAPGVFSARWAGPSRNFGDAMRRVREEMADAADQRAWFTCALALAWPDGITATFMGRVDGTIRWPPRGDRGFGYDPMFRPVGAALTYGEMEPSAKQASSHRGRAFAGLAAACLSVA
jgi:XTP/dITP diphosphohydrolase